MPGNLPNVAALHFLSIRRPTEIDPLSSIKEVEKKAVVLLARIEGYELAVCEDLERRDIFNDAIPGTH